jgi:hypothetical protein
MHCGSTRFARLPYVFGPSVTSLAELSKRMRRQGLTLRVTRRFFRGHVAEAKCSFCAARGVYSFGQERRAPAMRTFSDHRTAGSRTPKVVADEYRAGVSDILIPLPTTKPSGGSIRVIAAAACGSCVHWNCRTQIAFGRRVPN